MAEGRRSARTERCYRLVCELLGGAELDRMQIARLLGVKPATADRHMDAIKKLVGGIVVGKRKRARTIRLDLEVATKRPSRPLAVAASFGASLAQLFRGSAYEALLPQVLDYIVARMVKPQGFEEARRKFIFVSRGGEMALLDRPAVLDELVDAVLAQQRVRLEYQHFDGRPEALELAPWSIALYDHQVYVIGQRADGRVDVFRLSRIKRATRTAVSFAYPDRSEFDPHVLFRDTFGIFVRGDYAIDDIELRLSERWRTYAKTHRWHESQKVRVRDDGVYVALRVRTCPEFESLILGFGEDAEVIRPDALRARISARATKMAAAYARPRPSRTEARPAVRRDRGTR